MENKRIVIPLLVVAWLLAVTIFFKSGEIFSYLVFKWEIMTMETYTLTMILKVDEAALKKAGPARTDLVKRVDERLRNRIGRIEIGNGTIVDKEEGLLTYKMDGLSDVSYWQWFLPARGKLEFYPTFEIGEVVDYFNEANKKLRDIAPEVEFEQSDKGSNTTDSSIGEQLFGDRKPGNTRQEHESEKTTKLEHETEKIKRSLSTGEQLFGEHADTEKKEESNFITVSTETSNPLFELLYLSVQSKGTYYSYGEGPIIGRALPKDTQRINRYLSYPGIKQILPSNLKLLWGVPGGGYNKDVVGLYAIYHPVQLSEAPLTGKAVTEANYSFDQAGMPMVEMKMNVGGSSIFERMTREATSGPVKKCIAIVIDDKVFSAPRVQQVISNGQIELTGIGNLSEAIDLSRIISSGELEAPVTVVNTKVRKEWRLHWPF